MSSFAPSSPLHPTEGVGQGIISKVCQQQWYALPCQVVIYAYQFVIPQQYDINPHPRR